MIKRAFDIIASGVGLILLSPLLAIIAILIKLDSSGPVFYRGERIGKDGKPFGMYKFRTMVANAEKMGPAVTYNGDPRITKMGRLLRRTKLDELPQLLNVLRGEMSFVGPRPESPVYVAHYTPEQWEVLRAKPGVTGLTQIKYRNEEAILSGSNLEENYITNIMPQKLAIDMEYIRTQSLLLDFKILLGTVLALAR